MVRGGIGDLEGGLGSGKAGGGESKGEGGEGDHGDGLAERAWAVAGNGRKKEKLGPSDFPALSISAFSHLFFFPDGIALAESGLLM